MPEQLASWEVEDLVAQIHAARAEAAAAQAEREADPAVQKGVESVAIVRRALDLEMAAAAEVARKYDERVAFAEEKEMELRRRIEAGWPHGEGKTIGLATMTTRRSIELAKGLPPCDAFRKLDIILGATGALPKVVVGLKLDAKAALVFAETMPALGEVLRVEETRSLTIRAPKEA